ncbi:hypothetical protein RB195_004825 [Necator americanus]|uniref:Uncharacterized protein n=1 Tax=Necator americanus TaxID=51031 RepID=A0ABR1BNQ7_NECAM
MLRKLKIVDSGYDLDVSGIGSSCDVVASVPIGYVPPKAAADVEEWLCEDKPMIEEELNKQNNLLMYLHRQNITV